MSPSNDIVLVGPGIQSEHCYIENQFVTLDCKSKYAHNFNSSSDYLSSRTNDVDHANNDDSYDQNDEAVQSGRKNISKSSSSVSSLFRLNRKKEPGKVARANLVTLYPIAKLCAIDGVLIEDPYQLQSGL